MPLSKSNLAGLKGTGYLSKSHIRFFAVQEPRQAASHSFRYFVIIFSNRASERIGIKSASVRILK